MAFAAGSRVGPYEIISTLGAGGMGEVYRARDTRLGRDVAIKALPPEFYADPVRRRRFDQEARAASTLNHPNIVTIFDVGQEAGLAFIVLDLVEGETLRSIVARGALPITRTLDIAIRMADGLAGAHNSGRWIGA